MPNRRVASALAGLVLLGGCARRPPPTTTVSTPAAGVCRVGPDGGPIADKGIGGTGGVAIADRGIGGTGGPQIADRGIGGTGIIAVISGFASLCLAGQEVALPADTPILLGSEPSSVSHLRAGQVAVVDARNSDGGLSARRVTIRYEVSGPVLAATADEIGVAGQRVVVTAQTLGLRPGIGDWVSVSGIRRKDGVIAATRLEARLPGPVVVHGVLRREGGGFHIGTLTLARVPGIDGFIGQEVTATGALLVGQLSTESVEPDLLASDPALFFGPTIGVVLIEGYGEIGGNRLRLGQGFAAPVVGSVRTGPQRGIYRFERSGGGLRAVQGVPDGSGRDRFRPAALPDGKAEGYTPAPMPDRAVSGGDGAFRRLDTGGGPGGGQGSGNRPPPDPNGPVRGGAGRGR